jgi:hypothetical protein
MAEQIDVKLCQFVEEQAEKLCTQVELAVKPEYRKALFISALCKTIAMTKRSLQEK